MRTPAVVTQHQDRLRPPALKRGHVQVELLKRGGSARRSWPAHGDTVSRTHGATAAVADMLTYLQ